MKRYLAFTAIAVAGLGFSGSASAADPVDAGVSIAVTAVDNVEMPLTASVTVSIPTEGAASTNEWQHVVTEAREGNFEEDQSTGVLLTDEILLSVLAIEGLDVASLQTLPDGEDGWRQEYVIIDAVDHPARPETVNGLQFRGDISVLPAIVGEFESFTMLSSGGYHPDAVADPNCIGSIDILSKQYPSLAEDFDGWSMTPIDGMCVLEASRQFSDDAALKAVAGPFDVITETEITETEIAVVVSSAPDAFHTVIEGRFAVERAVEVVEVVAEAEEASRAVAEQQELQLTPENSSNALPYILVPLALAAAGISFFFVRSKRVNIESGESEELAS